MNEALVFNDISSLYEGLTKSRMKSLDSFCFKENFKQCDNLYINYSPILGVALGVAPGHAGVVAALGVGLYEGVWAV